MILSHEFELNSSMLQKVTEISFKTRANTFEDEQKVKQQLKGLIASGKVLLFNYGINRTDLSNLTEKEILTLSLLLYAESKSDVQTRGGNITNNHYLDCAMSALGITSVITSASSLITNGIGKTIERFGARAVLKTIGKAAGKALSWVGWGLAAYDFVTCAF